MEDLKKYFIPDIDMTKNPINTDHWKQVFIDRLQQSKPELITNPGFVKWEPSMKIHFLKPISCPLCEKGHKPKPTCSITKERMQQLKLKIQNEKT